jgi:class 3 adenylate cyclase/predicted ATPase
MPFAPSPRKRIMPIFCFTDIEGSTTRWEQYKDAMGMVIARHYAILDSVVPKHGGKIIKKTGDGIYAVFPDAQDNQACQALSCAIELQSLFQAESWPGVGELRIRMGFHSGQAMELAGDYYGPAANRTARLMSLGWGGQILVSEDLWKKAALPEGAAWKDLGVHQVKDLPEPQHIFELTHASLRLKDFPPLKSISNRPHNLPDQLSLFVGRERELSAIDSRLKDPSCRLVSLVGMGGMGKSRLAIQVSMQCLDQYAHGVAYADFSALKDPALLAGHLASALKLSLYAQEDAKAQVLAYLKDKQMLILLDGFDQGAAGAALVAEILEAAPKAQVLVTSWARLNMRAETLFEVQGLDLPVRPQAADLETCGSGKFFLQQALRFHPGFVLKAEDRAALHQILTRLQGMPLGLELAAAWARALPLKAIAEKMDKDLRFLSSSRQDLPERHRSLKALFNAAWEMLAPHEQDLMLRLSVIRGAFRLPAAQAVARATVESLAGLADKSVLGVGVDGRTHMPEPLRQMAFFKLEEDAIKKDASLDLAARYYCRFAKDQERQVRGVQQLSGLAQMREEYLNIRQAWDWAVEKAWVHEFGAAARCLGVYTDILGSGWEWQARMEKALNLWGGSELRVFMGVAVEESQAIYGVLLSNLANYQFSQSKVREALKTLENSQRVLRKLAHKDGVAHGLLRMALFVGPEDDKRRPCLDEAMKLYHELGDANGMAWARRNLGYLLCCQGQVQEGRAILLSCKAVFEEQGNQRELAWCLNNLAQAALDEGELASGVQGLKRAIDLFTQMGDLEGAGWTISSLGRVAIKQAAWKEAEAAMVRSLGYFSQIRNIRGRTEVLRNLCEVEVGLGDMGQATRMVDQIITETEAAQEWEGMGSAMLQKSQLLLSQGQWAQSIQVAEQGRNAYAKAGSLPGQAASHEQLACIQGQSGERVRAREQLNQALELYTQSGLRDGEARILVRLGDLDFSEAKPERGEANYVQAIKISRYVKLGDYTLAALLGVALALLKQGRQLDALRLGVLCERALTENLLPASDLAFYKDTVQRSGLVMSQVGAKLMQSKIDEERAKAKGENLRQALKNVVEKPLI